MATLITKPMLAPNEVITAASQLTFPVLCTPKEDGIRCLVIDGKILSRSFKDIPNQHIQKVMLAAGLPDGIDGELVTLNPDGSTRTFNELQGDIMRESGTPDFRYRVFDYVKTSLETPYEERMEDLKKLKLPSAFCEKLLPKKVSNSDELEEYEQEVLAKGYEGAMVRSLKGPYKCGRASLKQAYLLKLKRFLDSEAEIIGFEEQMRNENEAEKDAFGRTKRSSAKEGLVPAGTLGKFLVRETGSTPWNGREFGIGSGEGLTQELRQQIWDNRDKYLGKTITYKYQPHGVKDLPRLPIWKGFRDARDL